MRYVTRHGKRIPVETLYAPKPKRKPFKAQWVKVPVTWIERLAQSNTPSTFKLAHRILLTEFRHQHVGGGGEIILSGTVTGLPRTTRVRAITELVQLGLIRIEQNGKRSAKVIQLLL